MPVPRGGASLTGLPLCRPPSADISSAAVPLIRAVDKQSQSRGARPTTRPLQQQSYKSYKRPHAAMSHADLPFCRRAPIRPHDKYKRIKMSHVLEAYKTDILSSYKCPIFC